MNKAKRQQSGADTIVQQQKLFEDRWSGFGEQIGIKRFSNRLKSSDLNKLPLFEEYETDFLDKISHDVSVAVWEPGTIIFEEGSYLDLAFFVVAGQVDVFVNKHVQQPAQPIFNNSFLATALDLSEDAPQKHDAPAPSKKHEGSGEPPRGRDDQSFMFLSSMDFDLRKGEVMQLGTGEFFGEIGTLNGWPQSVTACAAAETTLVQIRLPALREMKKKSSRLKQRLDTLYRKRALQTQLATTPVFSRVDPNFLKSLADRVELLSFSPGDAIATAGESSNALFLVRSGFVKLTQTINGQEMTVSYLSKGMTLGEIELLIDGVGVAQYTAHSVGFTEVVRITKEDVDILLEQQPTVANQLWNTAVASIKDAGHTRKNPDKAELIEFSLAKGLAQGNSMLVIDLDVCTRCDDCVEGCTTTHGGRPRFVREGDKYENFLIARSCYHCEDPTCLIGCPTGAIKRTNVAEVVAIEDDLCIGCGNCAAKCPYDAIVMHDTGETWSESAVPSWLRGRERKIASKCDLCYTSDTGPACVNSCPHSCAFRVGSLEEFRELLALQPTDA